MNEVAEDKFSIQLEDIPEPVSIPVSSAKVIHGCSILPRQQILLFSADDWEAFIEEWAHYQKTQYKKVARLSGANDMGIDVAGFTDGLGFEGTWDNYQCKHYCDALGPKTAIMEIGKCIWHAFQRRFKPPRKYYFMAPKDCGMTLKRLLLNASELKKELFTNWDKWCASSITSTQTIALNGALREYAESFDFSVFTFKPTLELLDEHRGTPYYAARFGGGMPDRPEAGGPPLEPAPEESRYIRQIMDAYSDHKKAECVDHTALTAWPDLVEHYKRQRESFYHAESLRTFARDNVPPGTFEDLQEEVYDGVVDIESAPHPDAFVRMNAVVLAATQLQITANGLISVTKIKDRRGICHQLANQDRLQWVKP